MQMRWCLITHPDLAYPAVVAEDSIAHYEARGYSRASGWAADPHLPAGQFPPLEIAAERTTETATDSAPERKPAKTSKENS